MFDRIFYLAKQKLLLLKMKNSCLILLVLFVTPFTSFAQNPSNIIIKGYGTIYGATRKIH